MTSHCIEIQINNSDFTCQEFYVNKECTQCGNCIKNCPSHNIIHSEKSVCFKWNCGLCIRCIYQCPVKAIRVHQPFKFIRINNWYDIDD